MKEHRYDYVIVGAGTAGCLLANRLSADPDVTVLLIEAGGKDDWIWIKIPVGYLFCINNPRTDWCFKTEPDPGLNGRSIIYARGKVLGGCSSINAMIYMRGQAADYDGWAQMTGDSSWNWESVLPVFRQSEDYFRGADEAHGAGGEWRVEPQRLRWDILDAYREAMAEAGIPKIDDFNRGDNEGCSYFLVNQTKGVRLNTSRAFLKPVMNRPNLTVMTDAQVRRITLDGRRCTGVELERGGQAERVTARVETILAAGSIGSPQILQLSGVGPGALLQQHGIAGAARDAGRRREPAGPPAAAHGVQGEERRHAEPAGEQPLRQGGDGAGVRALPLRPADDGAEPARRVHALVARARHRERRDPHPAAVARQVRRPAASVQRVHVEHLQPAADVARPRAHQEPGPARRAGHQPPLPQHRRGPQGRGRLAAHHAPRRGAARARAGSSPRSSCRDRSSRATRNW